MRWDRKYVHFLGLALEALPAEKGRLGLMCALAVIVHLIAFFFIQISYPSAMPFREKRTDITLFTPETAGSTFWQQKQLWYELNDPSRLMRSNSTRLRDDPLDIKLLKTVESARPQVILPNNQAIVYNPMPPDPLPKRALASLRPPPQKFHYEVLDQPAMATSTVSQWEEPLASRWLGPAWQLPSMTSDLLAQAPMTILLVAVDAQGQVVHALIETASGNSEVDLMAVDAARHLHFQPNSQSGLQWGKVSIFWRCNAPLPEPPTNPKASS